MATNDLFNYMRDATHFLQSEYERIQKRASEDPGTAGDNGEENWAELLRKWLPANYRVVTKGRIMNAEGECGPQVDILILSPSYPEILLGKKEYLEGGVLAAFECKLTLKAEHIHSAVKNSAEIRRLAKLARQHTPYQELNMQFLYGLLAHSHVWKGERSTPLENIEKHLHSAEEAEAKHPKEVLDVICVSDLASWRTSKLVFAGQHLISQMSRHFQQQGLWDIVRQSGGVIHSSHVCFANSHQTSDEKKQLFTPIGSFLTTLLGMLAWQDAGLRSLAEYFVSAQLQGAGRGSGGAWPLTVLSDDLIVRLKKGGCLVNGEQWNEWSMYF